MSTRQLKKYEILVLVMIVTALSCFTLWSGKAGGQEKLYPNKPIEVVVPFPPGGTVDPGTRIIVNELTRELGVPISIQYKPGANGVIGATYVTTAKSDGYTLLSGISGPIVAAPLMRDLKEEFPYNPLKDFTPIAIYAIAPNVLVSRSSSTLTSFDAVTKFAKKEPGKLNCSTSGTGGTSHFMLEVMRIYGVDITHVPAKGGAPALINLLGNHVDLAILLNAMVLPHVRSGELRMLVTTNKMLQDPEVPTMTEKGFPEGEAFSIWQGFLAPPNLPKPILDQLANSFRNVIQMPSVVTAIEKMGFTVEYMGPDEFKKKITKDYSITEKIAKKMGFLK